MTLHNRHPPETTFESIGAYTAHLLDQSAKLYGRDASGAWPEQSKDKAARLALQALISLTEDTDKDLCFFLKAYAGGVRGINDPEALRDAAEQIREIGADIADGFDQAADYLEES